MKISINRKVVDYQGPGCYNLNTGERVVGGHLHNDGKNGIEYVDLNAEYDGKHNPTHKVDLPESKNSFLYGYISGVIVMVIVSIVLRFMF